MQVLSETVNRAPKLASVFALIAVIATCAKSDLVVDCFEAASFSKKQGTCEVDGTLIQTGSGFIVEPNGHDASTHDWLIMVQDGEKYPSASQIAEIGTFRFCGSFKAEDGYTVLEVPFNDRGTYSGNYEIDNCGVGARLP